MGNKKSTLAKRKKTMAESTQVKDSSQVLSVNTKLDENGVACTRAKQRTGNGEKTFGTVSVKIEWQIEKFEDLVHSYKAGMSLCSEDVSSALDPRPLWKLQVYPNAKGKSKLCGMPTTTNKRRVSFFVCLRGPMMDNHETLRASYKLYIAGKYEFSSSTLIESGTYKFGSGGYYGVGGHLDYDGDRIYNKLESSLRVDGSLMLVAEVEFVSKPLLSKLRCTAFKLRESSGRNDCTLMVGDQEFKAHRSILSQLSPAFETMLQPYEEAIVQVKDYSIKAVKVLLDFAYAGFVDWTQHGDCKQEVLEMAANYKITELKRQAEEQLVSDIAPQTLTELVVLADSHSCGLLKKACARYLSTNYPTVVQTSKWADLIREKGELAAEMLDLMCDCYPADESSDSDEGTK